MLLALALAGDRDSVFVDQGVFFGGMALVTFGGAYAVLSYVAQAAVETYGWLSARTRWCAGSPWPRPRPDR